MLRSSTRASHSSRIHGLLGVLLLSGCAAGCATADLDANEEGSEALQLQGGSGEASIVSISALGTGCPAGTAEITIDGDGLSSPIVFRMRGGGDYAGPGGASQLSRLTDGAGIFPALFATYPDPMQASAPPGELGPVL